MLWPAQTPQRLQLSRKPASKRTTQTLSADALRGRSARSTEKLCRNAYRPVIDRTINFFMVLMHLIFWPLLKSAPVLSSTVAARHSEQERTREKQEDLINLI